MATLNRARIPDDYPRMPGFRGHFFRALLVVISVITMFAGTAYAEDPSPATTAPPAIPPIQPEINAELSSARSNIAAAQATLSKAQATRDAVAAELDQVVAQVTQVEEKINDLAVQAAKAKAQASLLKKQRVRLAIQEYSGQGERVPDGYEEPAAALQVQREQKLTSSASTAQQVRIDELKEQERALRKEADEQKKVRGDLVARRDRIQNTELPAAEETLANAKLGRDTAIATLARWEGISNGTNAAIMGAPQISGSDLARWFRSTGYRTRTTVEIEELAALFVEEGTIEGVRGDIAFAQSILETGYFTFPSGGQLTGNKNNFAGIGACDSCKTGYGFPDARTGVRAQIQLLRNYADPTATTATLRNPPVMPGYDTFFLKGRAPTWQHLTGTWASSTTYGEKIMRIYSNIVRWLGNNPPTA